MKTSTLLKGAVGALALSLALPAAPADGRRLDLRAAVHLSHRPLRRLGHADRRRHARLSDHAQRARRRHRRRQAQSSTSARPAMTPRRASNVMTPSSRKTR